LDRARGTKLYQVRARVNFQDDLLIVFKNVTLEKTLEQQKATEKVLSLFQYSAAHELFTPLNTIKTMGELLRKHVNEKGHKFITTQLQACSNLESIT